MRVAHTRAIRLTFLDKLNVSGVQLLGPPFISTMERYLPSGYVLTILVKSMLFAW